MDHGNAPTLSSGTATLRAAGAELDAPQLEDLMRLDRYEAGGLIGKGGMGEVRQCRDVRLDRNIALKTATTRNKAELSRFIREAQVQGQLEHPSIVPVYELGVGADGAPYFAMKRVRGESLFDVLARPMRRESDAVARFGRRKLLGAFLQVCQAVDYAHANGWIHRDLKPANIMLGDFGEVYVLDWGLARRVGERDEGDAIADPLQLKPPGLTTPGQLMGTPGYMSPEQVSGHGADVRSDVYALGAILFELLTGQMLARGGSSIELLIDTRQGVDARAQVRAPGADVPPELEVICKKATALDPAQRHASVRELHDAVDRVLAGERDQELRARLAEAHTRAALEAEARSKGDPAHELEHKKTALHEIGKAMTLHPTSRPAIATMLSLMAAVPNEVPPEVRRELDRADGEAIRQSQRASAVAFALGFLMMVVMCLRTVNAYLLGTAGLFLLTASMAAWVGFRVKHPRGEQLLPVVLISNLAVASLFFIDGPLTILPALAAANTLAQRVTAPSRYKRLILTLGWAVVLVPLLGSMAGLLPESFRFVNEGLLMVPVAYTYSVRHTPVVLIVAFVGVIGIASAVVGRVRDTNERLARERGLAGWTLTQLVPPEASPAPLTDSVDPSCALTARASVSVGGHGAR